MYFEKKTFQFDIKSNIRERGQFMVENENIDTVGKWAQIMNY